MCTCVLCKVSHTIQMVAIIFHGHWARKMHWETLVWLCSGKHVPYTPEANTLSMYYLSLLHGSSFTMDFFGGKKFSCWVLCCHHIKCDIYSHNNWISHGNTNVLYISIMFHFSRAFPWLFLIWFLQASYEMGQIFSILQLAKRFTQLNGDKNRRPGSYTGDILSTHLQSCFIPTRRPAKLAGHPSLRPWQARAE